MKINTTGAVKTFSFNKKCEDKNNDLEPKDTYIPSEIGEEKEHTQHLSNAGFGASSVITMGKNLKALSGIASNSKIARFVPGLNLGVAGIETYHAIKFLHKGEPVVAATSAGNAAGCMSSFLEESGTVSILASNATNMAALRFGASAFGVIGGVLGIVAGVQEIKEGKKIKEATGSNRTLAMGVLDIASGVTSLAGGALCATGAGAVFGLPCLLAASLLDISGIVVDYYGKKIEEKLKGTGSK
ncbi:MAG: hypothetical protein ABRQ37_15870 [Candidatus Eremiobacterota bacterium]